MEHEGVVDKTNTWFTGIAWLLLCMQFKSNTLDSKYIVVFHTLTALKGPHLNTVEFS